MRARRAVLEPVPPVSAVSGHPFGHGGAGDLKAFGDTGLRPTVVDDELGKFQAPFRGERGVGMGNVRDEGLRGIGLSVVTQSIPEVLTFLAHATHTTSVGTTARRGIASG